MRVSFPGLSLSALLALGASVPLAHAQTAPATAPSGAPSSAASAGAPAAATAAPANAPASASASALESIPDSNEPRVDTALTRKTIPNRRLLATGSVLLAGSYGPAVIGAAASTRDGDDKLYVPIAGPWLALTQGRPESAGQKVLLVTDGTVQGLGALAMLSSLLVPERITKEWRLIGKRGTLRIGAQRVRAGIGLGASTRF